MGCLRPPRLMRKRSHVAPLRGLNPGTSRAGVQASTTRQHLPRIKERFFFRQHGKGLTFYYFFFISCSNYRFQITDKSAFWPEALKCAPGAGGGIFVFQSKLRSQPGNQRRAGAQTRRLVSTMRPPGSGHKQMVQQGLI